MRQLRLNFSNHRTVGINLPLVPAALLELGHVAIQTLDDPLVILDLAPLRREILLSEELVKYRPLIVHRRNRHPSIVPGTPPAAIVNTEREKWKTRVSSHLSRQYLVE